MTNMNELVKQLQGEAPAQEPVTSSDSITGSTYVEKLASAIDFIVERIEQPAVPVAVAEKAAPKVADKAVEAKEPQVTDLAEILKSRLQKKVLDKKAEDTPDQKLTEQVLGKLLKFRAENKQKEAPPVEDPVEESKVEEVTPAKDPVVETPEVKAEDTPDSDEIADLFKSDSNSEQNEVSSESVSAGVEKAASVGKPIEELSLSDMLSGAFSADESESASESTKTASVRSDDGLQANHEPVSKEAVTSALRERLMKAVGKEV